MMEYFTRYGLEFNPFLKNFYFQEHPFPFALTYDMVLHIIPKCKK